MGVYQTYYQKPSVIVLALFGTLQCFRAVPTLRAEFRAVDAIAGVGAAYRPLVVQANTYRTTPPRTDRCEMEWSSSNSMVAHWTVST